MCPVLPSFIQFLKAFHVYGSNVFLTPSSKIMRINHKTGFEDLQSKKEKVSQ